MSFFFDWGEEVLKNKIFVALVTMINQSIVGEELKLKIFLHLIKFTKIVKFLNSNKYLSGEVESLPVEGSLSPDTYFVAKGENRNQVIGRMQLRQEEVLRKT